MSQTVSTPATAKGVNLASIDGFDRFSNLPYHSPTPGRLPMVAYLPNKAPAALDDSMCGHMKDCGINSAITSVTLNKIVTSMRKAQEYGITSIVMHSHLLPGTAENTEKGLGWCSDLVTNLKDEPGLGGYLQCREPTPEQLPDLNAFVRKIMDTATENNSGTSFQTPLVVQMLPEQAEVPEFEGSEVCDENHYLPWVQHCLGPGVWLSDSNACGKDDSGKQMARYMEYFNNLRLMELMSISTNRPFWATVRCADAMLRSSDAVEDLETDGGMLFGAMSALAYGAQALVFTNFRQALSLGSGNTLIQNETLLPSWDYVKPVISRIRKLEGVFLGAETIETVHTGEINMSTVLTTETKEKEFTKYLYTKMENPIGPLQKLEISNNGTKKGFMVSHLALMPERSMINSSAHNGEVLEFLVIVNQDIEYPQTMRLTLNPYYEVTEVKSAKILTAKKSSANRLVETKVATDSANQVIFTLEPGDAMVLRWK